MNNQQSPADWLVGAFKKNPESFLLLAAGAVLMMRQGSKVGAVRDASSRVSEAAGSAKDYAADVADRTLRSASAAASSASDYAAQAGRKASAQSERMFQQTQSTLQSGVNRVLRDQPLMIAIAGVAAGAAVASAFPTTPLEKDTLGPIADEVTEAAGRVGQQLKEATANAGEALKKAVDERGLNLEGAKEVVGEVSDAFKGGMQGKAGTQPKSGGGPGRPPSGQS
jgi:hypothetical protein